MKTEKIRKATKKILYVGPIIARIGTYSSVRINIMRVESRLPSRRVEFLILVATLVSKRLGSNVFYIYFKPVTSHIITDCFEQVSTTYQVLLLYCRN